MKRLIVGTAGHIDHGKTSLVKALTGTDTDRLKEEKRRGITIELGFASLDLPSGQRVGIVDVPGHEKFVKNMVAGATGIDVVAMIIAADEGVMPQTREHMEICSLLDIKHGLVVMTKTDLVDEEMRELALEDIAEFVEGTFLEDAPVLPVSSHTGTGIPELREAMDAICATIPERQLTSVFRLPVDRVFTMKGFGTVITGTLSSGTVSVGDTVMIYPKGEITSKIRGIQVHGASEETASAGMRTAINFQGLDLDQVSRGDVIADPDGLKLSYMVDASFHYLAANAKPLKNRTRVRFHSGTCELLGVLVLLDREELPPGDTTFVQFRLEAPVSLIKDDRYVIRSYSPVRTIGGGAVINPVAVKHKRFKKDILARLAALTSHTPKEIIRASIALNSYAGSAFSDLKLMTNLSDKVINDALQPLLARKEIVQIDKERRIYMDGGLFDELMATALEQLGRFHQENPLKQAMPKEGLKARLPDRVTVRIFNILLNQAVKEGVIVQQENAIRLVGHTVALQTNLEKVREQIDAAYNTAGLTPPYFREVLKTLDIPSEQAKDVLHILIKEGRLTKVKDDLYFASDAIDKLKNDLMAYFTIHEDLTAPQFKDITGGISRKYLIPLLEYFDGAKVTIRVGDVRKRRG
ncbi:MAG: selenocysteine-specific translation elongation factor [Deltaproteobacteria bacterium]|nr:MAG: selenocysteine-specific translation elongation factor [Deltaproteobacteria bacterium]